MTRNLSLVKQRSKQDLEVRGSRNYRTRPKPDTEATNLFHLDEESLSSAIPVVLLLDLPEDRGDQEESQEASRKKYFEVSADIRSFLL